MTGGLNYLLSIRFLLNFFTKHTSPRANIIKQNKQKQTSIILRYQTTSTSTVHIIKNMQEQPQILQRYIGKFLVRISLKDSILRITNRCMSEPRMYQATFSYDSLNQFTKDMFDDLQQLYHNLCSPPKDKFGLRVRQDGHLFLDIEIMNKVKTIHFPTLPKQIDKYDLLKQENESLRLTMLQFQESITNEVQLLKMKNKELELNSESMKNTITELQQKVERLYERLKDASIIQREPAVRREVDIVQAQDQGQQQFWQEMGYIPEMRGPQFGKPFSLEIDESTVHFEKGYQLLRKKLVLKRIHEGHIFRFVVSKNPLPKKQKCFFQIRPLGVNDGVKIGLISKRQRLRQQFLEQIDQTIFLNTYTGKVYEKRAETHDDSIQLGFYSVITLIVDIPNRVIEWCFDGKVKHRAQLQDYLTTEEAYVTLELSSTNDMARLLQLKV